MSWLDMLLGVILVGSTVAGLMKGFVRTAIGIAAAILALLLALWFYGTAGSIVSEYVSSRSIANFLGFIGVFALVLLAGALMGRLLAMLFKWAGISWVDRVLGGCFGVLRGLLVATSIVMVMTAFTPNPPPRAVVNSFIAPYVMDAARMFSKMAPRELTDGFQTSYEKIRGLWADPPSKAKTKLSQH